MKKELDFKFEEEKKLIERAKKLPILKTQKIEWENYREVEENMLILPTPRYSEEVYNWINLFYKLKLVDYNYIDNFEFYKNKNIEELTLKETLSYLTCIIRTERFADGTIAKRLEDGTIEKSCKNIFICL